MKICMEELDDTLNKIEHENPGSSIILFGDLNARTGSPQDVEEEDLLTFENSTLLPERTSMDGVINQRGRELTRLLETHGQHILNGRTPEDIPGCFTFIRGKAKSVIDYFCTNSSNLDKVKKLKVLELPTGADHLPLELLITTHSDQQEREKSRKCKKESTWMKWKESEKEKFQTIIKEWTQNIEHKNKQTKITGEKLYKDIKKKIINTASILRMKFHSKNKRTKQKNRWFDQKCKNKKRELRKLLRHCKSKHFENNLPEEYTEKRKEYKEEIKNAKAKKNKQLKEKLVYCHNNQTLWETINMFRVKKENSNELTKEEWTEYLKEIYPPKLNSNLDLYDARNPRLDTDICEGEILSILKKAKNKKSPGCDGITYEFYKNLPPEGLKYLCSTLNKVFDSQNVPEEWAEAQFQMIHKKGVKTEAANYRGIALLNTITKTFTNILQQRLYSWAEDLNIIEEGQAGFRQGRSCTDNLFSLYSALCINTRQKKSKVFACFVDFRRCFDSISHSLLWNHLYKIGVSSHIIRTIKSLYDKARVSVKNYKESEENAESENGTKNRKEEKVKLTIGLMQGDGLSPLLFLLFISDLTEYFKTHGITGIKINNANQLIDLKYADDLVLLANSEIELQKMLSIFNDYCNKKELSVNTEKTNVMIFRRKGRISSNYKFFFNNKELKIVTSYLYLGVLFTPQICFRENSKRAINKAAKASAVTNNLWAKTGVHSWENKMTLYQAIVKSTLLYAAEVWGSRYQEILEKAQVNYFKTYLFWPRNTPNYIVRRETGVDKLSTNILEKMLKWWVKILQMPEERYPKICFKELKRIEFYNPLATGHNWAAQLREELLNIGREDLYNSENPEEIKGEIESILTLHRQKTRQEDTRRISQSSYSDLYQHITTGLETEPYLTFDLRIERIRTVSHLRVASRKEIRIYTNRCSYVMNTEEICSICNRGEEEDLTHILLTCPMYAETRAGIKQYIIENHSNDTTVKNLLTFDTEEKLNRVFNYITTCMRTRSFIRFE
ncbi:hypothetical protein M8J76_016946 [Diaphorina citri]|nr:hypothetical protein M8J76_016946 [Diaphorina citri]